MTVTPGRRFGPYEVIALAGAGGMGEVYRARDTRIGRDVALKILPGLLAVDADRLRRFEQEARAAGLLNHPSIVSIFDVGTADDTPFLVSEFLEGSTLREVLSEGPVPARRAVEWARQLADGLAAAHEKGIAHRDLKPENVFVTRERRLKILDFGLAKLRTSEPPLGSANTEATPIDTAPGVVLGTVGYMAPEQVRGEPADHRADIFAFGAIFYELLTGRRAFARGTAVETMTAILREEPPDAPPDVQLPPALDRIARRCLEKRPEDRFQSARDLGFALEAISSPGVTSVEAIRVRAKPGRHLVPIVAGLGIAAAFAAGWLLHSPAGGPHTGHWRARRLVATPAQEFGGAISPDGKWVAYLSDAAGRPDVWVRFVAGGEAVNLTAAQRDLDIQNSTNLNGVDISPDGTLIAFDAAPAGASSRQYSAWTIPAPLGGTPRKLVHLGRGLRWSPDGRRIAYIRAGATAGDALEVADANGENARQIVTPQGARHVHWPAWSADGAYLYVLTGLSGANRAPAETFRIAVSGGSLDPVIQTSRRAVYAMPTRDGMSVIYSANSGGADLGLFRRSLTDGTSQAITVGVGEYAELRVSADGNKILCTLYEPRQSLSAISTSEISPTVRQLTDGSQGDLFPSISAKTGRIVFSSARSGQRNLWSMNPDGANPRPLTEGAYLDEMPAVSPDGQLVAFVSDRGGTRGIWIVPLDGGAPRRLVDAVVVGTPSWSPDGRRLAYTAPGGNVPRVWIVSIGDGQITQLPVEGPAHLLAWSPSDVIAYLTLPSGLTAEAHVRFANSRGERLFSELPPGGPPVVDFAAWSPDGKRLALAPSAGVAGGTIWIVEPNGREVFRRLVQFPVGVRPFGLAWTPDGEALVIGRTEDRSDLVLLERQP